MEVILLDIMLAGILKTAESLSLLLEFRERLDKGG